MTIEHFHQTTRSQLRNQCSRKKTNGAGENLFGVPARVGIVPLLLCLLSHVSQLVNTQTPVVASTAPLRNTVPRTTRVPGGLAMWRADGMALHQASLASAAPHSPKFKRMLATKKTKTRTYNSGTTQQKHCPQKKKKKARAPPQAFFTSQL